MASDFVLVPYGAGYLRLTPAEFSAAMGRGLAPGAISAPATPPMAGEALVDSREMGKRLSVPAEWCEAKAKEGAIPSVMVGRYRRFAPTEVLAALTNGHAD